jgi:hypothetical protein
MTIILGTLMIVPFILAAGAGLLDDELKIANEQ